MEANPWEIGSNPIDLLDLLTGADSSQALWFVAGYIRGAQDACRFAVDDGAEGDGVTGRGGAP